MIVGSGGSVAKMMQIAELLKGEDKVIIMNQLEKRPDFTHLGRLPGSGRHVGKMLQLAMEIDELRDRGFTITDVNGAIYHGLNPRVAEELPAQCLDSDFKIHELAMVGYEGFGKLHSLHLTKQPEPIPYTIRPLPRFEEPPRDKWGKFLTNPGSKYHK